VAEGVRGIQARAAGHSGGSVAERYEGRNAFRDGAGGLASRCTTCQRPALRALRRVAEGVFISARSMRRRGDESRSIPLYIS
jgi:hypothetical protein